MVKKATAKKPEPARGRAVATTKPKNEVGDNVDISLLMRQDAGDGVSTAAEDNIIPLIYILQAQSPQALKQKPEYIKGAVAGNIWPRGTKVLIDGEETGLPVIPVAFKKSWVEWRPDRGGFAGRHDYDATSETKGRPEGAEWVEDPKKKGRGAWELPSGNNVVETREHAVLALINGNWTGAVVSMSSTNHTSSRMWMGLMKDKRIPILKDGVPTGGYTEDRAPAYAYVYCLKTVAKSNDDGDWYGWEAEDGMGDGEETFITSIDNGASLYRQARQLAADFKSGAKVADAPAEQDSAGSTRDGDEEM